MPPRHDSTYTLPNLNVGVLLQENGDSLLTEDGFEILLENPVNDPQLSARDVSTIGTMPTRN